MDSAQGPEHPPHWRVRVHVSGVAAAIADLERFRANVLFTWHEDLVELDDELDILFRGQI
ncbi:MULTISPECIES: hypothetical protein [unclassified Streptomyces]|uniref:hypothetical protein n=1 Tax=unclassified Streptomyces TaxID=2593676 RepID=UPI0022550292|nr:MULTISPECIES: hypothetical protein [unclassified Streptomyces]MCX4976492.1 hypothetical protein [Streptomyces sp. NBC_00620]WRZ24361.1 hypothetical protein OHT59_40535 [Streptomyces sp. NBC_00243]